MLCDLFRGVFFTNYIHLHQGIFFYIVRSLIKFYFFLLIVSCHFLRGIDLNYNKSEVKGCVSLQYCFTFVRIDYLCANK